jgi:hypothetical protein
MPLTFVVSSFLVAQIGAGLASLFVSLLRLDDVNRG